MAYVIFVTAVDRECKMEWRRPHNLQAHDGSASHRKLNTSHDVHRIFVDSQNAAAAAKKQPHAAAAARRPDGETRENKTAAARYI